MSDFKAVIYSECINHDESIEEDAEAVHAEMTSNHSDVPLTALRLDDGEEIIEAASVQSTRRINVYENIPFAGGDGDYSILSVIAGPHSIGEGIFSFLTMIDSNKVRVQCVECRNAVKDFPWMDDESRITGSVKAWRAAFPVARKVNVSRRDDIVDADFVHIRGDARRVRLHTVHMYRCKLVTDAAFVQLRGIHTLDMSGCNQATITDAAFVHLRGIHSLYMGGCNQVTITEEAFVNLRGINLLYMWNCDQETITDAAYAHLRGIHKLDMSGCTQETITDAAFVHLRGIHSLDMNRCNQMTITEAAFSPLRGIHTLETDYCSPIIQYAAALLAESVS